MLFQKALPLKAQTSLSVPSLHVNVFFDVFVIIFDFTNHWHGDITINATTDCPNGCFTFGISLMETFPV